MTRERVRRILGGPNPRPVWQFFYMLRLFTSLMLLTLAVLFVVLTPAPLDLAAGVGGP